MGTIGKPAPAILVAGIMYFDEVLLNKALSTFSDRYGDIELSSAPFRFDMTDYYTPEMGNAIHKLFVCFQNHIEMTELPAIKHFTNDIELELARTIDGKTHRQVNIDPGYVTLAKLVLASTKDYSHRIYLDDGIYGETTLRYVRDSFTAIDTTYPDYQTPLAISFFNEARNYLKRNRKRWTTKQE